MANAGVVGMAEVVTPNSVGGNNTSLSGTPAMWAIVWTGIAVLILMFIHIAAIGRT